MSVTNEQINAWLAANPGATDPTIASAMNQYGVTTEQMSQATGLGLGDVQSRYNAAIPTTTAGAPVDYGQMVRDAYGSVGRTGIGSLTSNIDQAGYDYWLNSLQSGAATPDAFKQNFQAATTGYIANNPQDPYSVYTTNYLAQNKPAVVPTTTGNTGAAPLNKNHVVALGDSTTFGYNAGNQLSTNMVSSAQNALGSNYTIDNLGTNSTTVGDLLSNASGNNNWAKTLASDAGVVVLNYGLNEAYRNEDPATFAANLTKAVNDLKAAGKSVILQTPNIATGYDWAGNVSKYADAIRGVANATGSSLDDKYATTSGMENFFDPATGDTIHPSSAAYATLGGNLANVISGLNTPSVSNQTAAPLTVEDLYQQYAGRGSDPQGLQYWTQQFGDTIDANEVQTFRGNHAYNLAQEAATASGGPGKKGIVEAIDRQEPSTRETPAERLEKNINTAARSKSLFGLDDLLDAAFNSAKANITNPALKQTYSREDFNRDNPVEQMLEYQLIQNGVYTPLSEATPEQRLQAYANIYGQDAANNLRNTKPLFEGLTKDSTTKEISDAYQQFQQRAGGDTAANQDQAIDYLTSLGIGAPEIQQAYNQFKTPETRSGSARISRRVENANQTDPKNDALERLNRERRDFYRDTYGAKEGLIEPFEGGFVTNFASFDEYNTENPLERDVNYNLIKNGIYDYKNATREQRLQAIANFAPEIASEYLTPDGKLRTPAATTSTATTPATTPVTTGGITTPAATTEDSRITSVSLEDLYKNFGVTDFKAPPTTAGILSGFKYAKDSGINEASLKKAMGDDAFNAYKTGFTDYAKTGIANILSDGKLSFDEASTAVKFGRDYGYDAQKLATLTGTNKSVFDAIYKSYDDTTNTIVDTVLGADDVKTDGDKIIKALALQKQYGFTDEDLAKATDFTPAQVKSQLDPMRNFESDYNKLRADPKLTDDQIKTFLTTSMQNPAIKQQLGSQLQPILDDLNKTPQERILGQIEQQRNVLGGGYYQGVFGDPKVMSKILADKGVKSLGDLGEKEKFGTATAEVQYTSPYGPVTKFDDGTFGAVIENGDSGEWRMLPRDQLTTTYGTYVPGSDPNDPYAFQPLSEAEQATLKDGKYQKNLGTVVINKKTGEELTDTTHELAFQSSSGGLKEKKNFLTVQFAKDGTPMLVASKQKAGLGAALQDAMPLIAMALPFILPGLGTALGAMLPGAAVAATGAAAAIPATLLNQALTQGIISGGLTTLGGGQFEKGFLGGAISPVISSGIGSLMPNIGLDAKTGLGRTITGAGTGVIKGALQGGDFKDLLGQGVLSGLTNYGLGEVTKGLNLTPQQLNFATGIALPLAQGQKVNPVKLATTLAGATR